MSRREALQLQIDQLRWENERLLSENQELRGDHGQEEPPDQAAELESCLEQHRRLTEEVKTRRRLLRRSLRCEAEDSQPDTPVSPSHVSEGEEPAHDGCEGPTTSQLQQQLELATQQRQDLENHCARLERELQELQRDAELRQLRAVEDERCKWEDRERRLVRQLEVRLARVENIREATRKSEGSAGHTARSDAEPAPASNRSQSARSEE